MTPQSALALEAQAAADLAAGHVDVAFRLADRRCRIAPPAPPYAFVLRAEALFRRGHRAWALDDIRQALRAAPDDVAANRRMMAWGDGLDRTAAALAVARYDRDDAIRLQAVDHLRAHGCPAMAGLRVLHRRIAGWAVWGDDEPIEITVTDDAGTTAWRIAPDPDHPLGRTGAAARFDLPRPAGCGVQAVEITWSGGSLASVRAPGVTADPRGSVPRRAAPRSGRGATVIVPVYGDADATRACLASTLDALGTMHRMVVVDDASPDPAVKAALADVAGDRRVTVLVNERNLGFVGSINRALAPIRGGDVLLLNADTLVPPRSIDALAAVARSAPDIGTVTPFSNNGEFTSFPVPNTENPLPSLADVIALDALAAQCNRGHLVDLPSGIGFCLYVTRRCLDAVGRLSEDYHRGYLEDADFCLRARDIGFRNVCAASVYVGHAGGRSFAEAKRALVVRNLGVLERRFPNHRAECAAFMTADPLRGARAAIEQALPPPGLRPRMLVTTAGPMADIAADRARRLAGSDEASIIVEIGSGGTQTSLSCADPAGRSPQSLSFDLALSAGRSAFERTCEWLAPSGIEVLDLHGCPDELLRILLGMGVPLSLWATNPQLAARFTGEDDPGPAALRSVNPQPLLGAASDQRARLFRQVVDRAARVIVPDGMAAAILRRRPIRHAVLQVDDEPASPRPLRFHRGIVHLGIVPVGASWRQQTLIAGLAARLAASRPDLALTVVGGVADDEALMHAGHVFVTGPVDDADLEPVISAHGISHVLLALDRPHFGHPRDRRLRESALPLAYVDWSKGALEPRPHDLAIDPSWPPPQWAARIAAWLPPTIADRRPAAPA